MPRYAIPTLAAGQAPERLPLRPARSYARLRAREGVWRVFRAREPDLAGAASTVSRRGAVPAQREPPWTHHDDKNARRCFSPRITSTSQPERAAQPPAGDAFSSARTRPAHPFCAVRGRSRSKDAPGRAAHGMVARASARLLACGSAEATARPSARRVRCCAESSRRRSSEPRWRSIAACLSPKPSANRFGIVARRELHRFAGVNFIPVSGPTRASDVGRTEYAAAVVRSLAFWL